MQLDNKLHL